ncbi:hypothetical protein BV22DRAFT_1052531 [Leucogyrophana mollusca]|uniref:Uncharacterized protein n=1 Tax=Leucogyrophana mollusca TaxID=85980 RepID=A0ACB8AVU9_9AGAM|nr:hypothetical protein BV22DRAFT_1052531 [Leucogyrophana mollusca]
MSQPERTKYTGQKPPKWLSRRRKTLMKQPEDWLDSESRQQEHRGYEPQYEDNRDGSHNGDYRERDNHHNRGDRRSWYDEGQYGQGRGGGSPPPPDDPRDDSDEYHSDRLPSEDDRRNGDNRRGGPGCYDRRESYARSEVREPPYREGSYAPTRHKREEPRVYENDSLEQIHSMIMDRIGTNPRNLPEIKGLKAKLPDPYEGADNIAAFEGMTGQKADASRLDVMQLCLKGPAKEWFGQEVLSPDRAIRKWTFRGAVLAMHRRFVHEATAQQATDQFHVLRYDHKTGATAFFNGLRERASRMVQQPDEYTFRRRFLDGLPHALVEDVLKTRGISAEYSRIEDILREVKAMENVHNRPTGPHNVASSSSKRVEDSRGPPRAFKVVQASGTRMYGDRLYGTEYRPKQNQEQGPPRASKPHSHNHSQAKPDRKVPAAPMDTSKMTCYRCKGVGHIASKRDKCPDAKGQPQWLFTAQEVDEDVEMRDETEKSPVEEPMEEPMERGN